MKKNFKYGALIACMTTLFASTALSFAFTMGNTDAAAETTASTSFFQMRGGASVKLSSDGLRFGVRMSEDYYDRLVTDDANDSVKLYGYIAPVEEFDKVEEYKDIGVKVGGDLDESKIYVDKDGYYCANIVITNLASYDLIDRSFSSIVYIYDNNTSEYIYADLAKDEDSHYNIEAQNRTQYEIVNRAMLAATETCQKQLLSTYTWYGTEEYPIVIASVDEYNTFLAKATDEEVAELVSGKNVILKKEVTASVSEASAEVAKYATVFGDNHHEVIFNDGNRIIARRFVADGENAEFPAAPTRDGYVFKSWIGNPDSITSDTEIYAKWGPSKGEEISFADGKMTSYGVTLASGGTINSDSTADTVIGQKVVLSSGSYTAGAHPAGTNYSTENGIVGTVDQSYLAYDGNYGFNDYFVADFTGKNMPSIAFFANNYNNSMYYENGGKNGVVVLTGITKSNGGLYLVNTETGGDRMDMYNGKGLVVCGPEMVGNINSVGVNGTLDFNGADTNSDNKDVALGRANLDNDTQYRVIMGMQKNGSALVVVYRLYNISTGELVEEFSAQTWGYFSESALGESFDSYASGSIVVYGHFGTAVTLDKTYPIYEDTTLDGAWAQSCGHSFNDRVTFDGDSVVLGAGLMGSPTDGYQGPNANDNGEQAYYAFDGEYGLGDYVAFDFTGKNMPEVAFFAKNYDAYMYAEDGSKQGMLVTSGVMTWDGSGYSSLGSNCTKVTVSGPHMGYIADAAAGLGGRMMSDFASNLARANLVDGTQYRVIIGFSQATDWRAVTLNIYLYNLDTNEVVENSPTTSWNFFDGSNTAVSSMKTSDLVGSIVLYGKFANVTTTIDKLHGVFEDTTVADIVAKLNMNQKTVIFQNYDGTVLSTQEISVGSVPEYMGETPTRYADGAYSYTFAGWDSEVVAVTSDVTYTATYTATKRENVVEGGVTNNGSNIVLGAGSIGAGADYVIGQNRGGSITQTYLGIDGEYGLGDYIALDFTGKNMPEVMFFAENYNTTMYGEGTAKRGMVVASGITLYNGSIGTAQSNNTQVGVSGPYGAYFASAAEGTGGSMMSNFNSALARANLVDGTHYRVIIGFAQATDSRAITLNIYLYNLDTDEVVENSSTTSWNFFTGSNTAVGSMTTADLVGSIVLYGKFGTTCTIDKLYGVFEDTDVATIATALNGNTQCVVTFVDENGEVLQQETLPYGAMPVYNGEVLMKEEDVLYTYAFGWDKEITVATGDVTYTATFTPVTKENLNINNTTLNGDQVVLGAGSIGAGADYVIGQNRGGSITQAYLGIDGEYGLGDYIMLDFTGKNMPEIMFFAENYNTTMYGEGTAKRGMVVASGITLYNGSIGTAHTNNTQVGVSGPYGAYFANAAEGTGGSMMSNFNSALARANLVDGTQYRVIIGIAQATDSRAITVNICLYNLDTGKVVENSSTTSWNFFTGSNTAVGSMTTADLVGSIVLYGKFGTTCTIDKLYGVFEDTDFATLVSTYAVEVEEDTSTSTAPDYSQYTDTFDFYGYSSYSDGTYEIDGETYYVGKNLGTLKQYGLYGSAGMTIYFPQSRFTISDDPQSIVKAKALIDDLKKAGIKKTILHDSRISTLSMSETAIVGSGCQFATEADLDTYIYNCLEAYADYEGVYGIMLGDEPKYSMLSAYAAVYNSLKRVNAATGWDLFIQYNLNPLNVSETVYMEYYPATSGTYDWDDVRYTLGWRDRFTDCMTRYQQYITDFLNAMQPDHIMYDDYPLHTDADGNNVVSSSYIPCLQFVAKEASDRGIKFYHITQSYENDVDGSTHRRYVTEKGAKWLNNILLGFGVKQIAYYTYNTKSGVNSSGTESYVDGSSFVDYNGNPTSLYYTMQGIMANNQIFASTILQFDYLGSRVYNGSSTSADDNHLSEITTSDSFTKLSAFSVDKEYALVTELYDDENGNYMYMAMNVVDPDAGDGYTETMTLTFSGYTMALVYRDGKFETVELADGVMTVTADPGEAVYVIPYN